MVISNIYTMYFKVEQLLDYLAQSNNFLRSCLSALTASGEFVFQKLFLNELFVHIGTIHPLLLTPNRGQFFSETKTTSS